MKSVKMFLGMMIFLCALASQAQAVILDFETLNTVYEGDLVAYGAAQSPKVTFSQDWETGIKKGNDYIVEFSVEDELIGLISFDSGIDSLTLEYSSTATEAYVLIYDKKYKFIRMSRFKYWICLHFLIFSVLDSKSLKMHPAR